MPVSERERCKDHVPITKVVIRFDQMNSAQFMIFLSIQPGANQVSLIREDQDGIIVESQMNRRAISQRSHWRIIQRPPDFLAGPLVESHDARTWFATDQDDQEAAFDQRAGRKLRELFQLIVLAQMPFPNQLAVAHVETQQMARRSQSEHAPAFGDGCRTRPGRILWVERWVAIYLIGVSPQQFAGLLVKTVNTL